MGWVKKDKKYVLYDFRLVVRQFPIPGDWYNQSWFNLNLTMKKAKRQPWGAQKLDVPLTFEDNYKQAREVCEKAFPNDPEKQKQCYP